MPLTQKWKPCLFAHQPTVMKKTYASALFTAFLVFATAFFIEAKAQKLVFLYGHGQYNLPQGRLANAYDYGLGAQAGVGVGLGGNFAVGTASYQYFPKNGSINNASLAALKIGYRRTFALKRLFVQFNGGLGSYKYSGGSGQTAYTADALIGAKLLGLEVTTGYESFGAKNIDFSGMIVFKLGFNLGL